MKKQYQKILYGGNIIYLNIYNFQEVGKELIEFIFASSVKYSVRGNILRCCLVNDTANEEQIIEDIIYGLKIEGFENLIEENIPVEIPQSIFSK